MLNVSTGARPHNQPTHAAPRVGIVKPFGTDQAVETVAPVIHVFTYLLNAYSQSTAQGHLRALHKLKSGRSWIQITIQNMHITYT